MSLPPDKEKKIIEEAIRIVKTLFKPIYKGYDEYSSEEKNVTTSNLRNMLESARESREKGLYEIFKYKALYAARQADPDDELYIFVRKMISQIEQSEIEPELRPYLCEKVCELSIYYLTAIKAGFRRLLYPR